MRFVNPLFLLVSLLIPVLHRWWFKKNQATSALFTIAIPIKCARKNPLKASLIMRYIAFLFLILALARPQSHMHQTQRHVQGIEMMMALDVSASMRIEDLSERSRIEVAKETIEKFIQVRADDRIGFVMFSGEAVTMMPPTLDYALLLDALHQAEVGILKDGTAIGDGLALTLRHLKDSQAKSRVVILLTDGDNNIGQVDPATAGEMAVSYNIRVYTIAIGREGRVKMPIRQKGAFGRDIVTYQWFENALNPDLLKKIAQMTNGKFYRVSDEGTLAHVFHEIDQLEKTDIKVNEIISYEERFQIPLILGIFLLLLESILQRTRWRFLP